TEITESVRAHWPDHKPLFVRLSVEDNAGWGPEQSVRLAKILKAKGVDVIDCSSGGITEMAPILGKEIKYSYQVPLSEYVRRHAWIRPKIHCELAAPDRGADSQGWWGRPLAKRDAPRCAGILPFFSAR